MRAEASGQPSFPAASAPALGDRQGHHLRSNGLLSYGDEAPSHLDAINEQNWCGAAQTAARRTHHDRHSRIALDGADAGMNGGDGWRKADRDGTHATLRQGWGGGGLYARLVLAPLERGDRKRSLERIASFLHST